ncbi:MAG: MGMT family protein [Spongiibacter sp.]|nr:MGMT family protein [Spongiibacter sp.]
MPAKPSPSPEPLYLVLGQIPHGRLCSYGQLATLAGYPGQARWVGRLLGKLPNDSRLPWHRVVNAQGKISFPVGSPAYHRQLSRLIAEGSADHNGKLLWRQRVWP